MIFRGLLVSILFPITSFSLTGCEVVKFEYVVLREVPESPSFVVIPANNSLYQVDFAHEVEQALISLGVKVVQRPATKLVKQTAEAEKERQMVEDDQAKSKSFKDQLIQIYAGVDIDADYIISVFAQSETIRIQKRSTREILAVLRLKGKHITKRSPGNPPRSVPLSAQEALRRALPKMGIFVR